MFQFTRQYPILEHFQASLNDPTGSEPHINDVHNSAVKSNDKQEKRKKICPINHSSLSDNIITENSRKPFSRAKGPHTRHPNRTCVNKVKKTRDTLGDQTPIKTATKIN